MSKSHFPHRPHSSQAFAFLPSSTWFRSNGTSGIARTRQCRRSAQRQLTSKVWLVILLGLFSLVMSSFALGQTGAQTLFQQVGNKLVGTGASGTTPQQGSAVALSADGSTAAVGGYRDAFGPGAIWVYTKSGGVWSQQGGKLVGSGRAGGNSWEGYTVALSADGNTLVEGGRVDGGNIGAFWVFTRTAGVWSQQGPKLIGSGAVGNAEQGYSVSISADGNTLVEGGFRDNGSAGAVWVYTRSGGVWTQQGAKLVGTGATGTAGQGTSVSLSADGNTLLVGGFFDNGNVGGAWVFTRSGTVWTQQAKLVGTGATGASRQGSSAHLSADGNTAILGGPGDNGGVGGMWVFTRSGGAWSQQGSELVGSGANGAASQGNSVSLSADGNTAIEGGYSDNGGVGAAWVFTRSAGVWSQLGTPLLATDGIGPSALGYSVALSGDGTTAIAGGTGDNSNFGAAWVFGANTSTSFGNVNVGANTTQTIALQFSSNFTLGSIGVVTQGLPNLDFTLAGTQPSSGACTVGTAYVAGDNCSVNIQLSPTAPGLRYGAILFYDNGSPANLIATVYISGIGLAPQAAFVSGLINTVAGNGAVGYTGDGGLAVNARITGPYGMAIGNRDTLFIYQGFNGVVRRVNRSASIISTVAGNGSTGYGGDGGPATSAQISKGDGLAIEGAGNLYIADSPNRVIRNVQAVSGTITTVAGTGAAGSSGDGGPATAATFGFPAAVVVDGNGNFYITDQNNHNIRKVTVSTGIITTIAGIAGSRGYSGDGGPATSAQLNTPLAAALDSAGNLYFSDDGNSVIRRIDAATGIITTVAGVAPGGGYSGDGGPATSAQLNDPEGLVIDSAGNLYIADSSNNVVRKVSASTGIITTIAGNITTGYAGDGGSATAALVNYPVTPVIDSFGNLYFADLANNVVREVSAVAPLSFGNVIINANSAPQDVTFTNDGSAPLTLTSLVASANFNLNGPDTSCTATTTLNPGDSCILGVEFAPTAAGPVTGTITLVGNAGTQIVPLSGTGVAAPPNISKAFGAATIPLNGSTSLTLTIQNPNTTVSLTGLAFTDTLPAGLVIASPNNLSNTCGGTATAVAGSSSLTLSAGTLATSASCTVSISVTGTTVGVKNNSVQITSTEGGTGNTATASLTVVGPPVIIKAFGVASIPLNGSTSLTFTIQNNNTTQSLSAIAFSDTLPAGLVISTPNGLTGSCGGGAVTATQATSVITLSGATLAQSTSCTFSANVTGTVAGLQNNTTGNITSTEGGTGGTASASINVVAPPSIAKIFNPAGIPMGGTTSLTFTITNPLANTVSLTGVAFIDTLPTGLTVTTTSSAVCGGTLTTTAPTGIALAGATIAINVPCSFSVTVTGVAAGQYTNTTGSVSSTNGGTGNTATTNLAVAAPPTITKAFGAATVPLNGSTTLTFTLNNPNVAVALTGLAFTDTFPSGLVISSPNGLTGTCGGGTIIATAGSSSVTLTGATLAAAASCNFSLNVTGITVGPQSNTTGPVSSTQSGNGATSNTATLTVLGPPSIAKSFGAASILLGANTSLTFTISNPNAITSLTGVAFTDTLPAGLVVGTPNGVTGACGAGTISAGAGTTGIDLSGGTIPANGSCNFSVNVTATAAGTQVNTTGAVTSTNGGTGNTATASLSVVPPDLAITKSHIGNFTQSQVGAIYTLTVSNVGLAPAAGTVTVTDTLPAGLTATAISGIGWICVLSNLSCTRSDALAPSASFPPITLTVNVAFNAAPSIVNTATVSGGGEITTGNDTATDTTNVIQVIDLGIAKSHAASFFQGQSGATYAITVTNVAGAASSGVVTVVDTLPPSLTATAMAGNGWSCTVSTLTCTRSDSLGIGASYTPITLTVNVAANAPASVTNTAVISGGGDSNTANNTATDPTIVTQPPDFSISASPTSDTVRAGRSGSYTLTLTPVNQPFTSPITFTATGLPLKSAFVVTPASVTPGASPATCEAVIFTVPGDTFTGQLVPGRRAPLAAVIPMTGLLLGIAFRRKLLRQAFRTRAFLFFLLLACSLLGYGCASSATNFPLLGTTPGTYTVTITGTSGAIQHSTTVTLTVTP